MKKIGFFLILVIVISCEKSHNNKFFSNNFIIEGTLKSPSEFKKIYLNYIINNEFVLMDSAIILNDKFTFKGYISSPIKANLQFYPNGAFFPFILYGENAKILLDESNLMQSSIYDSAINQEWAALKTKSMEIYGTIDYLYPQLQKSRIQNDLTQLIVIHKKIDSIDILNRKFLLDYVHQNPNSKLNGLILNDLYANQKNDSLPITKAAEKLPIEMQKTLNFKIKSH